MIFEWIVFLTQSVLETIVVLAILSILNVNAWLTPIKVIVYVAAATALSAFLNVVQSPFSLLFTIGELVGMYLILKKPPRALIGNYSIDLIFSIGILSLVQLVITVVFGLIHINLFKNELITIVLLIAIIIFFLLLSSNASVQILFETYYLPYRTVLLFSTVSLLFLIFIIHNIVRYHEEAFSMSVAPLMLLMMSGYFIINLLFAISLFRAKRATEQSKALMKYGDHLQNVVDWYREFIHDYKRQLQMIIALSEKNADSIQNKELSGYIQDLIDIQNRKTDTSLIKDSILISTMLNIKKEYAQQNRIDFKVDIENSIAAYEIPQKELIDILSNLIDNAFEETEKLEEEKRSVQVQFDEKYIEVNNTVTLRVKKEKANHIFFPGYSSKGSGHGYGLSKVLTLADQYHIVVSKNLVDNLLIIRLEFN